MNYISTRGKTAPIESAYAAAGIYAPDGGLYVPEEMPRRLNDEDFFCLAWLSHRRRFAYLLGKFMKEMYIGYAAMFGDKAFDAKWLKEDTVLSAPPQLALRPLPIIFEYNLAASAKGKPYTYGYGVEPDRERRPLIIVPSMGEEAHALIPAVKELTNGKIAVFYPKQALSGHRRSLLEAKQDKDVLVQGIDSSINEISHSITQFMKRTQAAGLAEKYGLYPMRADSQSWFCIVAQAARFISAYCEMIIKNHIGLGEWINLSIPYEDTLETAVSAFYAKELGMNADKIFCPAPADSLLNKLITTGKLDASCVCDGTFIPVALERLLYALGISINDVLAKLSDDGHFMLPKDAVKNLDDAFYFCYPDDVETGGQKTLLIEGASPLPPISASADKLKGAGPIALEDITDAIARFMRQGF